MEKLEQVNYALVMKLGKQSHGDLGSEIVIPLFY